MNFLDDVSLQCSELMNKLREILDEEISKAKTVADQYRAIEKHGAEVKNKWGLTTPEQQKQRLKMQDKDGEGSHNVCMAIRHKRQGDRG